MNAKKRKSKPNIYIIFTSINNGELRNLDFKDLVIEGHWVELQMSVLTKKYGSIKQKKINKL